MAELNVKETMELFAKLDISEFTYRSEGVTLEMKKSSQGSQSTWPAFPPVHTGGIAPETFPVRQHLPASPSTPAIVQPELAKPAAQDESHHLVKSPLVGTFYRSPAPGQKDFVQVGQKVAKGDVLCIVEAMKVMNTIEADKAGEVVAIVPESGALVEFGSVLFKIKAG